jgi:flagellar assembly protein FliH
VAQPRLEIFEAASAFSAEPSASVFAASEEERLAAYEQGYTAGWDDATAAQSDDQAQISTSLAHNLQSIGFTFHEARMHVLGSLEPLLIDLTTHLLPALARASMGAVVAEVLTPIAEDLAETPIEIVMNPSSRPGIEAVLERTTNLPLRLTEEPSLGEGQVYLRYGQSETRIDLDAAIAEIVASLDDFFKLSKMEQNHG